jgi:hypothetical protein
VKKFLEGWRGYPPRSARWRPARADRETVGRKSDLEAAEIPSPGAARGPDLAPSEQEPGPWQQAFPAAWYELVCPKCGLVDDCVGIPHDCPTSLTDNREDDDSTESDVTEEIVDYLASDQGRYDALIAALIIRAR